MAVGGKNGYLCIWDCGTLKQIGNEFIGHTDEI